MLMELLKELSRSSHLQSVEELARALGTTPELVRAMRDQLVHQGYLQEDAQCLTGCAECPLSVTCPAEGGGTRLWSLTEKGRRALH